MLNRGRGVSEEIVQVATILVEGGDPLCSQCLGRIAGGPCVCVGNSVLKGLGELLERSVKDAFPVQGLNEGGRGRLDLRGWASAEARAGERTPSGIRTVQVLAKSPVAVIDSRQGGPYFPDGGGLSTVWAALGDAESQRRRCSVEDRGVFGMEEADACPTQCACTEWVEDEVLEAGGRREVVADACQCRGPLFGKRRRG